MSEDSPATSDPAPKEGGVSSENSQEVDELKRPPQKPLDAKREDARLTFTMALLVIFGVQLAVGAVALFWSDATWTNAEEFLRVTLPATIGLLGSAIGFYFGSER